MAINLSLNRLLPLTSQTRVGKQTLMFSLGTLDPLVDVLAKGFIDGYVNKNLDIDSRLLQDKDIVFVNYSSTSAYEYDNWVKTYVFYDSNDDSYQLRLGANPIYWEPIPAGSANWTSNANIGMDINGTVWVRGNFTSLSDTNNDAMAILPDPYKEFFICSVPWSVNGGGYNTATLQSDGTNPINVYDPVNSGDIIEVYFSYQLTT